MSWFLSLRNRRIGDLNARLTVIAAERNAARDRAERIARDFREEQKAHATTKDLSAARAGHIEHLEGDNARLRDENTALERRVNDLMRQLTGSQPGIAVYARTSREVADGSPIVHRGGTDVAP